MRASIALVVIVVGGCSSADGDLSTRSPEPASAPVLDAGGVPDARGPDAETVDASAPRSAACLALDVELGAGGE